MPRPGACWHSFALEKMSGIEVLAEAGDGYFRASGDTPSQRRYPRRFAMRHSHTREDVAGCLVLQRLKSVWIVSFAFLLDGSISKAARRGTRTFDCIVPETEGFPQSVFQHFCLCIECILSRRRNGNASHLRENHAESLRHSPNTQTALL
jgi:hypothetical protein